MTVNERAGQPAEASALVDVERLVKAYYEERPDPGDAAQQVAFGTSGHRGSALKGSFNEAHILATTEAICRYRSQQGIDGPLYLGRDTHALSEPAQATALEVLAAHGVQVRVDSGDRPTPTPAHLPCHPRLEPGPARAPGRRHRRHPLPQPARGRRLQVQPAQRRPGRHRHHRLGPGRGQPAAPGRAGRRPAGPRPTRRRPPPGWSATTTWPPTSTTWPPSSTWRRSGAPGCAWASTPSAGRPSTTGRPSPSATGWSWRWSTRRSTPPSGS